MTSCSTWMTILLCASTAACASDSNEAPSDKGGKNDQNDTEGEPVVRACEVTEGLETRARELMQTKGMIRDGEELEVGDSSFKWRLIDSMRHEPTKGDKTCLLVMAVCANQDRTTCELLEVLGQRDEDVMTFEELQGSPEVEKWSMRVRIDRFNDNNVDSGYFVELNGESAIAAIKADLVNRKRVLAFSGAIVRGEKPSFDPTPGRNWTVVNPRYDLRRGITAEVLDVYAGDFDADFEATFDGCLKEDTPQGPAALVGPWDAKLSILR
jgi:hypothetical protein